MDRLRRWFTERGGSFHSDLVLVQNGPYGVSVLAPPIDKDTTVVTCPLSLIITQDTAKQALQTLLGSHLGAWSERQLICTYLCFHQLQSTSALLRHRPYVECLPPAENLLTPLHFTTTEREILRGTNLFGATLDRERDWRAEWEQCRSLVQSVDSVWGEAFTWNMYLTASTHLSSRAFPSSILSENPSLVATPSTYPVLIPGVDLLNHKRGQPVSWIVDNAPASNTVSIVAHPTSDVAASGLIEVFNNYGPKPNDELILGYGFSLADNPDDTIALQIGGRGATTSKKWIIGRHAHNVQSLWSDVRRMIVQDEESENAFEDDLETAVVLSDMVQAKLDGMCTMSDVRQSDGVRPAVKVMLENYIAGQRDILESILEFLNEKRRAAIDSAREQGIDLVFEEEQD